MTFSVGNLALINLSNGLPNLKILILNFLSFEEFTLFLNPILFPQLEELTFRCTFTFNEEEFRKLRPKLQVEIIGLY